MRTRTIVFAAALTVLPLAACGSAASTAPASAPAKPSAPSPASVASALGCQDTGPDTAPQDAYDTVAYDGLSADGNPASPCYAGNAIADAVITFASEAKETDWLKQNDLANSGQFANGYTGLVEGPLWVVPDGLGVVGLSTLQSELGPLGGREVTAF